MIVRLQPARPEDAIRLTEMQARAFMPIVQKRGGFETSPAAESPDQMLERITDKKSRSFIIMADDMYAGMIRIKQLGAGAYKISPIFVLPEFQNMGIGKKAISLAEEMFPSACLWTLFCVREDEKNVYFYEKLGFQKTGCERKLTENITLIGYERRKKV
ncbi:MAG: GNAT family N-acetyltransferase [Clostridia bacterium]|nr:GNAT family N-acetyltransferase [Clostridia bacterium]